MYRLNIKRVGKLFYWRLFSAGHVMARSSRGYQSLDHAKRSVRRAMRGLVACVAVWDRQ